MEDDDDVKIDEFLDQLNLEEFQAVKSGKEIGSNFSALNEVLEPMNETQLIFENPELKIDEKIRNRVLVVIPMKANNPEDDNFLKDIKLYKTIYELDAKKSNELVENVKENFKNLSGNVQALINSVEKSKKDYYW